MPARYRWRCPTKKPPKLPKKSQHSPNRSTISCHRICPLSRQLSSKCRRGKRGQWHCRGSQLHSRRRGTARWIQRHLEAKAEICKICTFTEMFTFVPRSLSGAKKYSRIKIIYHKSMIFFSQFRLHRRSSYCRRGSLLCPWDRKQIATNFPFLFLTLTSEISYFWDRRFGEIWTCRVFLLRYSKFNKEKYSQKIPFLLIVSLKQQQSN